MLSLRELLDCKLLGTRILDLSTFFERVQGQVRLDSLRASWLIYGDGFRQGWTRTFVKRCFDLVVGTALLLVAMPIMVLTALLILLEDGAPIFTRRSVWDVVGSRSVSSSSAACGDAEKDGKPRWATSNDDRVTMSAFHPGCVSMSFRRLFNVLKGDMSLVGPRPSAPYFVDQRPADSVLCGAALRQARRHRVGAGSLPVQGFGRRCRGEAQYDLYYVKNHSR